MIVSALAAAALVVAADQREWPSAGGFDIYQMEDGCVLEADYPIPGRAPIRLAVMSDGSEAHLMMTSTDWSARKGENYDLSFTMGRWAYTGKATGIVEEYVNNGFIASFDSSFLEDFAAAPGLYVTRNETVVANLSLTGTSAATRMLSRCVAHVTAANAAAAERERRVAYIAADPFSDPPTVTSAASARFDDAEPSISWSRPPRPSFPARALERGVRTAQVRLECQANANGSLTSCSILNETPAGEGFGRAAILAAHSARLSPASADLAPASLKFVVPFQAD